MSSQPNWFKGYVPPAEEWNLWWSKKLDEANPNISVIATGSTTPRTMQDRAADWVNVKDFGAKLDGTANVDGPAVGAALATLQPHESLFVPGGTTPLVWGTVQGTTPITPVLFKLDGTTSGTSPILRAFSRRNKGDLFETFFNGLKYFSKRDPEKDSQGVLSIEHLNDDATNNPGTNSLISIPMRVTVRDNVNAKTSMWGVHVAMDSYSNQSGWPQNVGISSSVIKHGAAWLTGIHVTSQDSQQKNSLDGGAALLGMELGHHADLADNAFNGGIWGSTGLRQGIGVRQSAVNSNLGLAEFSCSFIGGSDYTAITKSVYIASSLGYAYQVFDARGPTPPPSYIGPIAGLRMAHEQVVDFNGGPQLDSAAGNYLQYTTTGTPRLRYMVGATEQFAINNTGQLSGPGIGYDIGDIPGPIVSQGGIAALRPPAELIFQRNAFAATDGQDFHFRRSTAFSGGTPTGNLNKTVVVETGIGAGDACNNWGFLSTIRSSSTTPGAIAVGGYFQSWKNTGNTGFATALIAEVADQTGLNSAQSGVTTSMEWDISATGVDDGLNGDKFGGIGLRQMIHAVFANPSTTVNSQYSAGIWFGTQVNGSAAAYVDSLLCAQATVGSPLRIRSFLDSRGAVAPIGVTDPVAAVRMSAGQIVDFAGGPALNSAPGAYLQYRSGKLYYVVAGVDKWSIDASGNVRAAGTVTGSVTP